MNIGIQSLGLNDINKFNISDKIIEYKYEDKNFYSEDSINSFINKISNPTPTPGGGSVAALTGALASALSSMVANLTINKTGYEKHANFHNVKSVECQKLISSLLKLIDSDSKSYDNVIKCIRLPKKTNKDISYRNKMIENANISASKIPLQILYLCKKVMENTYDISRYGNPNSISDIAVSAELLNASSRSAAYNILINIKDINKNQKLEFKNEIDCNLKEINDYYYKIIKIVNQSIEINE